MLLRRNPKRGRKSESENEENKDRLSDLPDCVLLHILSFVNAKYAVQTCTLSTRWKDLWKRLPSLILHSSDFFTLKSFAKFVSRLLTLRDGSTALKGLDFNRYCFIQPHLLERIVKYAVSHNVQRIGLSIMYGFELVPPCIFSCETLTSLKLEVRSKALFPESLNLPALTTLHLVNFAFCANGNDRAEPFSSFKRLNSLTIFYCCPSDVDILCISSTTLCNLTVDISFRNVYTIDLSSPSLRTLAFKGRVLVTLTGRNLSSIEHVNLEIWSNKYSLILLSWLLDLANIKSLTVYSSTLEVLSSIPDILELKYPILGGLKSLKVLVPEYKFRKAPAMLEDPFSLIPYGIVDFLLQNSPSAKVDVIKC
ncbi:F-box/LRR-repeat protein 13-like isoform X2 [Lotus japonicus]|nr:F-box/LRR-repeat protein 13-like isoform X2 [Lotus japonicus]XP_057425411.1 F-box/LRR-repeat protein 13-like isoform X2 [Lotus japonicus]